MSWPEAFVWAVGLVAGSAVAVVMVMGMSGKWDKPRPPIVIRDEPTFTHYTKTTTEYEPRWKYERKPVTNKKPKARPNAASEKGTEQETPTS